MYTLLFFSVASFFGIFYILASNDEVTSYRNNDLIYHPGKGELNKSLFANFFRFLAKSGLASLFFLLRLINPLLVRIQKMTGDKLRDVSRKISMSSSVYSKSPDVRSQSSFFKDLAKHKKLVAKRGK